MSPGDNATIESEKSGYDIQTGTYHLHHDWDSTSSVCYTVVRAVSAVTGTEPQRLEPINEAVNPDALRSVFHGRQDQGDPTDSIRVVVAGCDVVLQRDGHVIVHPPEPA